MKLWSRGKRKADKQVAEEPVDSTEQAVAAELAPSVEEEEPGRRRSGRAIRQKKARAESEASPDGGAAEAEGAGDAAAKPRPARRGSGKAKKTAAAKAPAETRSATKASGEADEGKGPSAAKTTARKHQGRGKASSQGKGGRADGDGKKAAGSRGRGRRTPARPTPPSVKKEMLVSVGVGEQQVAILEDDRPVEVYLERRGSRSIAGNIYKGVVENVLPGMEASFVDIGLERSGFLYVDEIVVEEPRGVQKSRPVLKRQNRPINELVSRGQEILVQAVKDPMGTKGARLTTQISLPGRFLVYVPSGEGIGVSRRLSDEERERLQSLCKGMDLPEGGIIVRTAAEGASEAELAGDIALLRKLWATISGRAQRAEAPTLVYQEWELPLRVVRDLFTKDYRRLVVDHERTHRRIVGYLRRTSRELAEQIHLYHEPEPLMRSQGVDAALRSTLNPRVDLPSGGYLIFDYAEALTVIDVNTGRFVGPRGQRSGARLEDTITQNNLEAAQEIVRQLRLRDIGGIVVIDFIDMESQRNRTAVEEALANELARDRTKTYVVEISPLGLVEMTRQNVTDGPREILTRPCPTCQGDGIVISDETTAVDAERTLRELAARSTAPAMLVELAAPIARILIGPAGRRLAELERDTGKYFAFETKDDLPSDHLAVLRKGTVAEIEPRGLPVAAGEELELKLEQEHATGGGDAIGRIDGYVVTVEDGANRIGSTVRVRIERATRTAAYASVADGPGPAAVEPPIDPAHAVADGFPDDAGAQEQPAGEAPKKKTRRGSRGGKRRKKPAVEAGDAPKEQAEREQEEAAQGAVESGKTPSTKPASKPKSKAKSTSGSKAESKAGSGAKAKAKAESKGATESETAVAEAKRPSKGKSKAKSTSGSKAESKAGSGAKAKAGSGAKAKAKAESKGATSR